MISLRFVLIFSALPFLKFFLIGAFTIGDRETETRIDEGKKIAAPTISLKGLRLENRLPDSVNDADRAESKREGRRFFPDDDDRKKSNNKPKKTKGKAKGNEFRRPVPFAVRDGPSEEEYDYFYEYESDDYRKESRSFIVREPDREVRRTQDTFSKRDGEVSPCPGDFNGTYPVAGRCDEYLVCLSGRPIPHSCPEGLRFDLITKRCNLPHNSVCNYACPADNGYFGISGDCNGFLRCKDGRPRYGRCPPHEHWDFALEVCVDERVSSCPMKCTTPDGGAKPYGGDCESYVLCEGNEPHYRRCPEGTRFHAEKSECVPGENLPFCISDRKLVSFRLPRFGRRKDSVQDFGSSKINSHHN